MRAEGATWRFIYRGFLDGDERIILIWTLWIADFHYNEDPHDLRINGANSVAPYNFRVLSQRPPLPNEGLAPAAGSSSDPPRTAVIRPSTAADVSHVTPGTLADARPVLQRGEAQLAQQQPREFPEAEWTRTEAQEELDRIWSTNDGSIRDSNEALINWDAGGLSPESTVSCYGHEGRWLVRLTEILTDDPTQRRAVQEIVRRILFSFVARGKFRENLGSLPRRIGEDWPGVPRDYAVTKLSAGEHKKAQRGDDTMSRWEYTLDTHYVVYEAFSMTKRSSKAGCLTRDLLVAYAPGSSGVADSKKVIALGATLSYAVQEAMTVGPLGCVNFMRTFYHPSSDSNRLENVGSGSRQGGPEGELVRTYGSEGEPEVVAENRALKAQRLALVQELRQTEDEQRAGEPIRDEARLSSERRDETAAWSEPTTRGDPAQYG